MYLTKMPNNSCVTGQPYIIRVRDARMFELFEPILLKYNT